MKTFVHRLVVLSILATVLAVVPLAASAAGPANSVAQSCQQGGYQHLYRSDGTGFLNAGDCVSYVALGGRFLRVGSSPSLTITFNAGDADYSVVVTGSDLQPGSSVWLYVYLTDRSSAQQIGTVAADGTLTSRARTFSCGSVQSIQASGIAADGTPVGSPLMPAPC